MFHNYLQSSTIYIYIYIIFKHIYTSRIILEVSPILCLRTPLRSAVQAQDSAMARLLLQARADPNDRDAKGVCAPRAFDVQKHWIGIDVYVYIYTSLE